MTDFDYKYGSSSSIPQKTYNFMCYPLETPNQDHHVITGMKILSKTEKAEEELRLSIDSGDRECTFGRIESFGNTLTNFEEKKFMEINNSDP